MWDFATDPEFQVQLDWMRDFIDDELIPLEPILDALARRRVDSSSKAHLQQRVKDAGPVGRVPRPAARRAGLRPAEAGADVGAHRALDVLDDDLRRAGARQRATWSCSPTVRTTRRRSAGSGRTCAARSRSAFALTEPFLAGADPTRIGTTAVLDGDEWVIDGHKWFITNGSVADIILVFAETNPENRPHKHASMFVVPAGTPGMDIVRDIPTMAHPDVQFGAAGQPRRDLLPRLPRARRPPHRQPGRRLRARAEAAGRRPHPPRHAMDRPGASARSTSCASARSPASRTASCSPSTR